MRQETRTPLRFKPGVTPTPDATKLDALSTTAMGNVRFNLGRPQSIGGNVEISVTTGAVDGCPRWLYNHFVNAGNLRYTLIGANTKLQVLLGNTITNITPLVPLADAVALPNNPVATTNLSRTVVITDTTHGLATGDRVKLSGLATTGGILAATLNTEFIITVLTANTYSITAGTAATSTVAAGGGAVGERQGEIEAGQCDASAGYGAGMGLAGAGLAGVGRSGTNSRDPRIWSGGRFGNNHIMTPGDEGPVLQWTGATTTAPEQLTNAPDDVNYVYVTNDIVVALGPQNTIRNSDQGAPTDWTPTAANQAQDDDIEGAGTWISHCPAGKGVNLLYTNAQVWLERYVGAPLVFTRDKIKEGDGIIGRNARVSVNGVAYWMGRENLYRYAGGQPEVLSFTAHDAVFNNLHPTQYSKAWLEYREDYNEVRAHYVSADSPDGECDRVMVISLNDNHVDEYAEAYAAGSQGDTYDYPISITHDGVLTQQEYGVNDNGAALSWFFETNLFAPYPGYFVNYDRFYPDGTQSGDIQMTIYARETPQGVETTYGPFTITPSTEYICPEAYGKYFRHRFEGASIDGYYRQGNCDIGWKPSAP
jgi:hypothetical protein